MIVVQAAIGITQYATGIPELLVVLHVAGAAACVAATAALWMSLRPRRLVPATSRRRRRPAWPNAPIADQVLATQPAILRQWPGCGVAAALSSRSHSPAVRPSTASTTACADATSFTT